MRLQESGEMYLEAILVLSGREKPVRSIDVGEYLGYTKPSVSRAMTLLRSGGYLELDKNGFLVLTEEGRAAAGRTWERHRFLTRFLTSLGVEFDWSRSMVLSVEAFKRSARRLALLG